MNCQYLWKQIIYRNQGYLTTVIKSRFLFFDQDKVSTFKNVKTSFKFQVYYVLESQTDDSSAWFSEGNNFTFLLPIEFLARFCSLSNIQVFFFNSYVFSIRISFILYAFNVLKFDKSRGRNYVNVLFN